MLQKLFILLWLLLSSLSATETNTLTQKEQTEAYIKILPAILNLILDDQKIKIPRITAATVGEPYRQQIEKENSDHMNLIDAPEGMSINPQTGIITWTPTPNQVGDVSFEIHNGDKIETINLTVKEGNINNINVVFISPHGSNDNNGSYDAPLLNTKKLCTNKDETHPDLTIYFRGGIYHNPNFGSGDKNNVSIPQIKCSGEEKRRVTIKPWGNEKPKIEYDSSLALSINANYINIEGLEIKGVGDKISYKEAVANWWRGDRYYNGNGFAVTGHHIEIKDNIFAFVPAQAIAVKKSDYVTLKNNIVYNSAWWSISGTNAMSINDSNAVDDANITHNKIEGNLIFGVESRIYSRVWSKGRAHLTIDEGGAILVQVNDGNYTGRYLVENNIALFTGKGIISNKTPKVDMLHNTIYDSGTTMTGKYRGLRGNKAHNSTFKYNTVTIFNNEGMTLSLSDDTTGIQSEKNCAIKGDQDKFTNGFTYVDKLYTNPTALDFSIDSSNSCDKSVGASSDTLKLMLNRAKANGIELKPTNYVVDYPQQTKDVIAAIPEGANIDFSNWSDTEAFDINVTNIPSGIKGRPSSFVLEVVHPYKRENIAKKYGIATQGSTFDSQFPASNVIDGNLNNYNHTSSTGNWLQIEIPQKTKVASIRVYNRNDRAYRLDGAKVYLLDKPYQENQALNEINLVSILKGTKDWQEITFTTPKEANYLLIKLDNDQYLDIAEVEIYGVLPQEHLMHDDNLYVVSYSESLDINQKIKLRSFASSDNLIYTMNDENFEVDSSGFISAKKSLVNGYYKAKVSISDGSKTIDKELNILVSPNVAKAYGVATEGGNNAYTDDYPASNAIDGERTTYHHTSDDSSENWLQIKIPSKMVIKKINILNRQDYGDWKLNGAKVYLLDSSYDGNLTGKTAIATLNGTKNWQSLILEDAKSGTYLLIKNANYHSHLAEVQIFGELPQEPYIASYDADITLDNHNNSIGSIVTQVKAYDFEGAELTYEIIGNVPFSIDSEGDIRVDGDVEATTYDFDIKVSSNGTSQIAHITIDSTIDTAGINSATEDFLPKARDFSSNSNVDDLLDSYINFSQEKAKVVHAQYMEKDLEIDIWSWLNENADIKEGLYASSYPANPHIVQNLSYFIKRWRDEGKSEAFIQKYKNVALGMSVNAREVGVSEILPKDYPILSYKKKAQYEEEERRWKENFNSVNMNYLLMKYGLVNSERYCDTGAVFGALRSMKFAGVDIANADYDTRKKFGLSFAGLNLYRVTHGLERADCYAAGNPCQKIKDYIEDKGMSASEFLIDFKPNAKKVGLINATDSLRFDLRGELNVVPKEMNVYNYMSFYDFAMWKITNDNIAPIDFNDTEPNWPLFKTKLHDLPWQIMAIENSINTKDAQYIKGRFFETDKSKLSASYPKDPIDQGSQKEHRFILGTTYTWSFQAPEVQYKESNWGPDRYFYRGLDDGGVCGLQSTMGQHAYTALNRPSTGSGQPAHRAWVSVYNDENNISQLYINIGYSVGSKESATPYTHNTFEQYTMDLRKFGIEKFAGIVTGTSGVGVHRYNQSMMLQHIAKILIDEGSSPEAVLRKSIKIAPQNVDAWYQLALYFAQNGEADKVVVLAQEYHDKRDSFFMDFDSGKGAYNFEIITQHHILFALLSRGEATLEIKDKIWNYLDKNEAEKRSVHSYMKQNRYLAKLYLEKLNDPDSFIAEVKELYAYFLEHGYSAGHVKFYFEGVNFKGVDKEALYDELEIMTLNSALSNNEANHIIIDVLKRDSVVYLENINANDVCTDPTLSKCQNVKSMELNSTKVYLTTSSDVIGETNELAQNSHGKNRYSILTIPIRDNNDTEFDLKVRVAKVATSSGVDGKLLKINDPTAVEGDKTKIIVWIDLSDNQKLQKGVLYHSNVKARLNVFEKGDTEDKKLGMVAIDVQNLMLGEEVTFKSDTYIREYAPNPKTSYYYVVNDANIGPTTGVWHGGSNRYTTLTIPVVDEDGNSYTLKLRGTHNYLDYGDMFQMNAGYTVNYKTTLKLEYLAEDNEEIVSGTHLKSIRPFTIDAKKWHIGGEIYERIYMNIDFVTP